MITAGIDVGLENIKIVILGGGQATARRIGPSGGARRAGAVEALWAEALDAAGLSSRDIARVAATGQGKFDVSFAELRVVEPAADAKAARFYCGSAASVVDIGADQVRVVSLADDGSIREVALNQKCAAGLGVFLEYMARRLEMTLDDMSGIPISGVGATVNDGCPVFAELDAMSLLNLNVPRTDVAGALVKAAAVRINSVLNEKIKPAADSTVLIGGLSKNAALVEALKIRSGIDFIIPEDAEYGGAVGAALLAAESV